MTVGNELRQARENARVSARQVSDRTKIQLYKIEALENSEFDSLPQGIYLDGIVRAYAHEVGIDPEPLVDRVRLQRGRLPGDWEVPFATPIDLHGTSTAPELNVLEALDGDDPLDGFIAESDGDLPLRIDAGAAGAIGAGGAMGATDIVGAPIAPNAPIAPVPPSSANTSIARVAATPVAPGASIAPIAPIAPVSRIRDRGALALLLLAVVAGAGGGAYVYESTRLENLAAARTAAPEPRSAESLPVPYSENAITPDPSPRGTSGSNASAVSGDTRLDSELSTPPRPAPQAAPVPASRNAAVQSSARAAAPAKPQIADANSAVADVTGSWTISTLVESSSYKGYAGLKLGYELTLEQDGDRVTGVGRKVTENGAGIGPRAQTPLTVTGTIAGDRLTLNFVERGARRPTEGKFVLLVDDGETLRGRFTSTAAQSSGRVEAHRVSAQ